MVSMTSAGIRLPTEVELLLNPQRVHPRPRGIHGDPHRGRVWNEATA